MNEESEPTKPVNKGTSIFVVGLLTFIVLAVLSFALSAVVERFGGPWWLQIVAFVAPGFVGVILLLRNAAQIQAWLKRATPSQEFIAAQSSAKVVNKRFAEIDQAESLADEEDAEADQDNAELVNELRREYLALPKIETTAGKELPHLLSSANLSAGLGLIGAFLIMAFWNGIVSVFLVQAINGDGGWCLRIFLIPFVVVGLVLIGVFLLSLVNFVSNLLVGKVQVEISKHPLIPGSRFEVVILQSGSFQLNVTVVQLRCVESATYTHGTTTSTDTKTIAEYTAEEHDGRYRLSIPENVMHSFEARCNAIKWVVSLNGNVLGFLPFGETYAVLVKPTEQLR
jgi:hypothetical protein